MSPPGYSQGATNDFAVVRYNTDGSTGVAPASNVNVTFSNVTQAGNTVATTLSVTQLPPLPAGYSLFANSPAYDIRTSAAYTGNITVTFNVQNVADAATCARLRSLHLESDAWTTDTNAAPTYNAAAQVCIVSQTVSSLSPFVVAEFNPTYTISGQITSGGNPLANVTVTLTNGSTNPTTTTDAQGNYSFANLAEAVNYTVTPTLANYIFNPVSTPFNNLAANQTANFTASPSTINVSMPTGLTSLKNTALTVPVNVSDTSGRGIISYDFVVNYDSSVLTPMATAFDKTGTLSGGFEVSVNSTTPGTLIVSGFGANPLSGSGTLLNLKFTAIGDAPNCGALNFTSFQFNEGSPASTTTSGQACVTGGDISGTVIYGTSTTTVNVSNVALAATGTPNVNTTTATDGTYTLTGLGGGEYSVTPSKSGEVNNAVTALDASLISQYVIGTATFDANQQTAADISGNGSITSYDAGLTAQYVVETPNPGNAGTWRFIPASRTYANVETNQTNQDYTAILMGDVSGNWTAPQSFAEKEPEFVLADAVPVSLPSINASSNSPLTIPVSVGDLTGRSVQAYQFDLTYDASVLQPQTEPTEIIGTLSNGLSVAVNMTTPGRLRVAVYGTRVLEGEGTLLNLRFNVIGQTGASTALNWQQFQFNEGQPTVNRSNGQISISSQIASTRFDFDGDGKADQTVFRSSDRNWYVNGSQSGFSATHFGLSTDKLVPADYDGDGKSDIAVVRQENGTSSWYILRSSLNFLGIQFGSDTDKPVPADYDGDGKTDIAVYRDGAWYMLRSQQNFGAVQFGATEDKPIPNVFMP